MFLRVFGFFFRGLQRMAKFTENSQSLSSLPTLSHSNNEILKGANLPIPKLLHLEEINKKAFLGKLKKFQSEVLKPLSVRNPPHDQSYFSNNSVDLFIFKRDPSLMEKEKNENIKNCKFFTENLKVQPVKILYGREFDPDFVKKRKEGFSIRYKLTKKKVYI